MPKNFQANEIYQIRFAVENRRSAQSPFPAAAPREKVRTTVKYTRNPAAKTKKRTVKVVSPSAF
jgi:hypothetical protein